MCRGSYDVACTETGCTGRCTCQHEMDRCPAHAYDAEWADVDKPLIWEGDNA